MSRTELDCLAGGGKMGAMMRAMDWAATPLGPVAGWPQSLRTTVSVVLGSSFPMMIAWGPDLWMLYNDAYLPVLGTQKHPRALGRPLLECFSEIGDMLGNLFGSVMRTGEPVGADDMMFALDRHGYTEETYYVFSYSPIRDESGAVGGVLTTCTETTARVVGARRLRALRVLAERAARATSVHEALAHDSTTLDPAEFPFAMLYELEPETHTARLVSSVGVAAGQPGCEATIDLSVEHPVWPLREVAAAGKPRVITGLDRTLGQLPGGPWPEPSTQAVVLPIARPGVAHAYAFMIAGVSPRRALDESYQAYFELVADHIATGIANARAHEEQRRRAEALAELDRAKTTFFSNISHEFRTPLTLILGPLEELLGGSRFELSPAMYEELATVHRSAQRMLKLVNSLLDFARIEAGRARASYAPTDLASLTRDLASMFRSTIERAGLAFVVDCPPLAEPVYVDPEMWEKIVLNLLSNAFKYTFEGEIAVRLRQHGERIELEVSDTGAGIPAHEQPKLFERFYRIQNARSRTFEGTGIGLALVRELLRLHGGNIAVESEPGKGSTFRATVRTGRRHLPAEHVREVEAPSAPSDRALAFVDEAKLWIGDASQTRGVRAASGRGDATILVIDDNADMRDYACRILGQHWRVHAAVDGRSALDEIRRSSPDLVLSDVMMPGLDGFELLAELRADPATRQIPVIMLSARAGEEARIEGLRAGADDYLTKPFSARELIARVGSQLALARTRAALDAQRRTLYSLFMQAPTPICILRGKQHVIELANPPCHQLWGRTQEQVTGRPLFEALPEIADQVFKELLDRVLATGEPYVGKETPAVLGSGAEQRTVFLNFVYSPLRGLTGEIEGVLVIAFDVTDEIRARDELARTVRFNELFAGMLGHDLRNPLGAIMSAAQLMLHRAQSPAQADPARRIIASGTRMTRMIDQLLDFTRLRLGNGLPLARQPLELGELARRVIDELETASSDWKPELEQIGDTSGQWDPDRLARMLSNLAGNARQHAASSWARIRIDGSAADEVVIAVENEGTIAPELLPSMFEPFAGTRDGRNRTGLGLGLYISSAIAGAHGGRIAVDSTGGRTRFTVSLPRCATASS